VKLVGLAAGVAAVGVAAVGAGVAHGGQAAVAVLKYLGPVALATVVAVMLVADRVPGLKRQLLLVGAVTAAGLGISVALFVETMYLSGHDALYTLLLAGYGLVIGGWSAWLLGSRALRRLAAAERARRDLVAAVSHDLRTPITSLQLLAEAVDDDIVDARTRHEYLARMTTHVRALSAMIADLFELSRLEAGEIRWTMQRVQLDALVSETVEALRPHAEAGGVAVRTELEPVMRAARAHPEQLQRVLFNLIQNAIRHTPADGSVVVRAECTGGEVQIEVADTGEGISDADRDRVFEAFFRGGAQAHGGRIWLADSGSGTRVRFSVPAA
jgi:signal transduction histidine kinase